MPIKTPASKWLFLLAVLILAIPFSDRPANAQQRTVAPVMKSTPWLGLVDKDKDGVPDVSDKCPNAYGKKTTDGCPLLAYPAKETIMQGPSQDLLDSLAHSLSCTSSPSCVGPDFVLSTIPCTSFPPNVECYRCAISPSVQCGSGYDRFINLALGGSRLNFICENKCLRKCRDDSHDQDAFSNCLSNCPRNTGTESCPSGLKKEEYPHLFYYACNNNQSPPSGMGMRGPAMCGQCNFQPISWGQDRNSVECVKTLPGTELGD